MKNQAKLSGHRRRGVPVCIPNRSTCALCTQVLLLPQELNQGDWLIATVALKPANALHEKANARRLLKELPLLLQDWCNCCCHCHGGTTAATRTAIPADPPK